MLEVLAETISTQEQVLCLCWNRSGKERQKTGETGEFPQEFPAFGSVSKDSPKVYTVPYNLFVFQHLGSNREHCMC